MGAVTLTGDFPKLKAMVASLGKIPGARRLISRQLAEESIELIREGFEQSRDPAGRRWDRLKLRDGRPLEDSGALKNSWVLRTFSEDGFSVASGKRYAIFHQKGTGLYGPKARRIKPVKAKALRIPGVGFRSSVAGSKPRRMVPSTRVPQRWLGRYREVFEEVMTELVAPNTGTNG